MFTPLAPSDFVVSVPFRWRGIMYETGGGLPAGIPQGAMTQFLHKTPPLIKLVAEEPKNINGTRKKKKKKARKKSRKKTARR